MTLSPDRLLAGTIRDAGNALRAGRVSATDLFEAAATRHETNGHLHAYKHWDGDGARARAEAADKAFAAGADLGPLQGIPISVKDIYGVEGLPIFAGSSSELPECWRREGPVVRKTQRQLSVITGKSHTVEFALGILGVNEHWGTPVNPWDAVGHRVPGGSSSGAGVSLIEGSAMLALGTDTAGSVRSPASMTGNVGLKITVGRWSTDGIIPLSPSLDTPGPLARSVIDVALAFAVIDPLINDLESFMQALDQVDVSGMRIGIPENFFFEGCSPGIAEAVERAIQELTRAGAIAEPCQIPGIEEVSTIHRKGGLSAVEFGSFVSTALPRWQSRLNKTVRARIEKARSLLATEYIQRRRALVSLSAVADGLFDSFDVLVSPTISVTPPLLQDVGDEDAFSDQSARVVRNLAVANLFGWCAMTMPVGLDVAGMPVGLQVMARGGDDEKLVKICRAFERILGTPSDRLGLPPAVSSI